MGRERCKERRTIHDGVKWPAHAWSLLFALLIEVLAMLFLPYSCTLARG
jgi:hypothetical protein